MNDRPTLCQPINMDQVKIIQLSPDRWEEYKNLRLEALQKEPQAFSRSYEEEINKTDEEWKERVTNFTKGENYFGVFAEIDGELVGMMNSMVNTSSKMKHVAYIHGVYVKSEFRGKGIGKMLLSKILDWINSQPGIVKVNLDVTTTQEFARKLYESFGFELVGKLQKEYLIDGKFYDVYEMEKYLK